MTTQEIKNQIASLKDPNRVHSTPAALRGIMIAELEKSLAIALRNFIGEQAVAEAIADGASGIYEVDGQDWQIAHENGELSLIEA